MRRRWQHHLRRLTLADRRARAAKEARRRAHRPGEVGPLETEVVLEHATPHVGWLWGVWERLWKLLVVGAIREWQRRGLR